MINMDHLTDADIYDFHTGRLEEEKKMQILEHIADCMDCAGRFSNSFDTSRIKRAPAGLPQLVKSRLSKEKHEFLLYSFRVAVATCASLLLVVWGSFWYSPAYEVKVPTINLGFMQFINQSLNQISSNLINGGQLK